MVKAKQSMSDLRESDSLLPAIFNIYKPEGPTSASVLNQIKRCMPRSVGKIGHFGTLDPFASGVLLIGVGGASRLNDMAHAWLPKTYLAYGHLGVETDTGDKTGNCIGTLAYPPDQALLNCQAQDIQQLWQKHFVESPYWQTPPAFSAVKHQGKALYKWAREGVQVQKPPVLRTIHHLQVLRYKYPFILFKVTVSSGTYIRTLFSDGASLLLKKYGHDGSGHLKALVRQSVGEFHISNALRPSQWPSVEWRSLTRDDFLQRMQAQSPDAFLPLPWAILGENECKSFSHGREIDANAFSRRNGPQHLWANDQALWVKDGNMRLLGLGLEGPSTLRPLINWSAVQ